MMIARVTGEVVASQKHSSHEGLKLLRVQPELLHAHLCGQILIRPGSDNARWLTREERGSRFFFGGLLVEIALTVHPVLMDDATRSVEDHHSGGCVVLPGEVLAGVRQALGDFGRNRHVVVHAESGAHLRIDQILRGHRPGIGQGRRLGRLLRAISTTGKRQNRTRG